MHYLKLSEDKYVEVDGDNSRVIVLSKEIKQAQDNLHAAQQELERCSAELVSTDGLDEKQREAVEQFNAGLAIDGRTQEVAELTAKLSELETINGQINHT